MIIRKPYAFLIKNFRKIHIVLLIISIYVAYKLLDVNSYVNEFMRLGTYDIYDNPISKHISGWLNLLIILLIIGSMSLLILLRYKKKPWKLYLIPVIEYTTLILVLSMIKNFFNGYSSTVDMADLRLTQDLLFISLVSQVASIAIFIMRILGLDTKKFQFNFDQEFLELSESDREEVEIGINIDKRVLLRNYKRLKRYANYFYQEHRTICRIVIVLIVGNILFQTYRLIFITHKSYSEGQSYTVNGLTFTLNGAYYTDKDYTGNIIDNLNNFLILDMTVENHGEEKKINLENFHIKNGTNDYQTTHKLYASEFRDLGTSYESTKVINKNSKLNYIIIYRVENTIRKNRFVLYYQEKSGYLRKIKLNVKDISKLEEIYYIEVDVSFEVKEYSMGDDLVLNIPSKPDTISFDTASIDTTATFVVRSCDMLSVCDYETKTIETDSNYRILKLDFSSENYEAKNMIDFLRNYGKLKYIDNENKELDLDIENAANELQDGKSVFLKIPKEYNNPSDFSIKLIIRNKQYIYHFS